MIITTTPNIEGKQIVEYKQVVFGEVIAGANFIKAIALGANAVVGVEINYATVSNKSMFMVIASGTAVVVR